MRFGTHMVVGQLIAAAGLLSPAAATQRSDPPQTATTPDPRSGISKLAPGPIGAVFELAAVPAMVLGPIDVEACRQEDDLAAQSGDRTLRYGLGRDASIVMGQGRWWDVPASLGGGRVWAADLVLLGALGARVHLKDLDLPAGATVYVYSPSEPSRCAGPYEGRGPLGDGTIWSPTLSGERVRIECRVPSLALGATPGREVLRIDRVQHIYRDPTVRAPDLPCHNDITCYPEWAATAKACAGVGFINQNSLFCSGQMLGTIGNDLTPYFVTANQCVDSWQVAQTCEIFYHYRSYTCDGPGPALTSVPRAAMCSLVWTSNAADFSLLMVEGTLPVGIAWAGWTSAPVLDGTAAAAIHFPLGSPERISFGTKASNTTCGGPQHVRMNWISGPTEPGSAGGGAFRADGGHQFFGQLSCGSSSCGNVTTDDFGSFAAVYPSIAPLLNGGTDDGLEPNDSCEEAVLVSGAHSALVVKGVSEDWYRLTCPAGGSLSLQVSFVHAHGDIDLQVFKSCGGSVAAASTGQSGSESIVWSNLGGTAPQVIYARVYLASDTRNTYSLAVTTDPGQLGGCCLPSGCTMLSRSGCVAAGGVFAGELTTCPSSCHVYTFSGAPVSIVDGQGAGCGPWTVASVFVPDSFTINNIGAGVHITHPYQGDLRFSLRHVETGTIVTLVDRPGVPQTSFGFANDNYGAGPSDLFRSVDGAAQVYDLPVAGMNNVTGAWRPESPLAAFVGENSAGTWHLRVQDCALGESGSLAAFRLTLAGASGACYANCDGSTQSPVLNANDFQCFVNSYAFGAPYANCDGSTANPVLSANDYLCFVNQYALGCN